MTLSPYLHGEVDETTIGVVEAVSPLRLEVALRADAPHGTGLREGTFHRFPRLNSYVVIPSERGPIVALINWVGVDSRDVGRDQEVDRIALPAPRRRLHALPLGVLKSDMLEGDSEATTFLDRGVLVFPTVGDPVRLPTREEAAAVVPRPREGDLVFSIGVAPLAGGVPVVVDPDRLFGRHLAILGNTGSGKSCTVVQLLRSAFSAARSIPTPSTESRPLGFRAIVLDLNDEFAQAFDDLHGDGVDVIRFSVEPQAGDRQFRVPCWAWNYEEWLSFGSASLRGQAPQLRKTLQFLRRGHTGGSPSEIVRLIAIRRLAKDAVQYTDHENFQIKESLNLLAEASDVATSLKSSDQDHVKEKAAELETSLTGILDSRLNPPGHQFRFKMDPEPLKIEEWQEVEDCSAGLLSAAGVDDLSATPTDDVDSPVPFKEEDLIGLLPLVAAESGIDTQRWVDPLLERIRIGCSDRRWRAVSGWVDSETLDEWLESYMGSENTSRISVIDLSLVPPHLLHLVVGVFVRLLLEAIERHRRVHTYAPPVLLAVEEAHSLIRHAAWRADEDAPIPAIRLCREAFERVAREGRKYGLSMIASSQRPSELSQTVLSQCNTFMVHRIVNDHDQDLVKRLVPDTLGGLLAEMPALPSQVALLLGWAVDLPTIVRISDLPVEVQPRSADPPLGATWAGNEDRSAKWPEVVANWQDV